MSMVNECGQIKTLLKKVSNVYNYFNNLSCTIVIKDILVLGPIKGAQVMCYYYVRNVSGCTESRKLSTNLKYWLHISSPSLPAFFPSRSSQGCPIQSSSHRSGSVQFMSRSETEKYHIKKGNYIQRNGIPHYNHACIKYTSTSKASYIRHHIFCMRSPDGRRNAIVPPFTKTALSDKCFNQRARPHSVSVVSRRCGTWMDRLVFPTAPPAVGRTSFTNMQML